MPMNRLTWHHAASGYTPSKEALEHYHAMIDGDGQVIWGNHPIKANEPGKKLVAGQYAAHTWKLNSGNIGVSILAMGDAKWANPFGGKYPVRYVQVQALINLTAKLAIDYSIPVDRRFMLSHAEVQPTLGVTQKNKWDYDYDPKGQDKTRDPVFIGDELRQDVAATMKAGNMQPKIPQTVKLSPVKQGSDGTLVQHIQRVLGQKPDGIFGPKTRDAVISFQKKHELLPDGIVGAMTLAALFPKGVP